MLSDSDRKKMLHLYIYGKRDQSEKNLQLKNIIRRHRYAFKKISFVNKQKYFYDPEILIFTCLSVKLTSLKANLRQKSLTIDLLLDQYV